MRFTEFSQLGPQRHEGTGLGLALTRRLVELHGESIHVQSEPGKGSAFTLMLPVSEPKEVSSADGAPRSPTVATAQIHAA